MKGQYSGSESTPSKHERPAARSNKRLDLEDGIDDAPTYVDTNTQNTLSQEEYDELLNATNLPSREDSTLLDQKGRSKTGDEAGKIISDSMLKEKELIKPVASIGAKTKKRAATVVHDEEEQVLGQHQKPSTDAKKAQTKKAKKIKISFENEEDD